MSEERLLAVIPARGGSKGIPKKNIQPINGKPLLLYAIDTLQASKVDMDIAVSSDSQEILDVAANREGIYAIRRPEELGVDAATSEDALIDALDQMSNLYSRTYTSVITVQPTSPFRTPETVRRFINDWTSVHSSGKFDAMLTLHATYADYWVCENEIFHRLYPKAPRRRQERTPLYVENSCLYATDADALIKTRSVLGTNAAGFIINEREALDINEPIDLELARMLASIN